MGAIFYDSMSYYILLSTRMTCMHLQHSKSFLDCLTFFNYVPKLRFQRHNLFDEFLLRLKSIQVYCVNMQNDPVQ